MSVNVANLELKLIEKINSATTELELLTYQKVLETLRTGSVDVVETFNDLPNYSENVGKLYFVRDENTHYWAKEEIWVALNDLEVTQLWSWGRNTNGQVGDGTIVARSSPVQEVSSSCDWCQVSGGFSHSIALKTSGSIWGWGDNGGKLGDGTIIDRSSPVQEATNSTDWCQVAGGIFHSIAIKTSGTLWSWGTNSSGGLGDDSISTRFTPVQEVTSSTDWCQVSGGNQHSLAIKTQGSLWSWGNNSQGQVGDGTIISRSSPVQEVTSSTDWCQVSGGDGQSIVLKTSGTLWAWGDNNNGKLGDGTTIPHSSPVQEISSSTNWCQVSTGNQHSLAMKTSGTIWGWGAGFFGRIGDETTISRSSPVQEVTSSTNWCQVFATRNISLGIKTSSEMYTWGRNLCGNLGDGTLIDRSSPVQEITSSTNWCQVSGGGYHSLAIKSFTV